MPLGCPAGREHDYRIDSRDCFERDGEYLYVYGYCGNVEITGSIYSERHDEYFYNEGASCDAAFTASYRLDGMRDIAADETIPEYEVQTLVEGGYDLLDILHENLGDSIATIVGIEDVDLRDFPESVTVDHRSIEATFELETIEEHGH